MTARPNGLRLLAVALAAAVAVSVHPVRAAGQEQSSSQLRATYGDWQLRCGQPPGAKREICGLVQSVRDQDRPNISLTVIILTSHDGKGKLMRVIAPLGVLLPPGLGLTVDNAYVGKAPFVKCGLLPFADNAFGCLAEVTVDEALIAKMTAGSSAVLSVFQTSEAGIGLPISLAGLSDGLANLN